MVKGPQQVESTSRQNGEEAVDPEEMAFNANLQKWQKNLDSMFGKKKFLFFF